MAHEARLPSRPQVVRQTLRAQSEIAEPGCHQVFTRQERVNQSRGKIPCVEVLSVTVGTTAGLQNNDKQGNHRTNTTRPRPSEEHRRMFETCSYKHNEYVYRSCTTGGVQVRAIRNACDQEACLSLTPTLSCSSKLDVLRSIVKQQDAAWSTFCFCRVRQL